MSTADHNSKNLSVVTMCFPKQIDQHIEASYSKNATTDSVKPVVTLLDIYSPGNKLEELKPANDDDYQIKTRQQYNRESFIEIFKPESKMTWPPVISSVQNNDRLNYQNFSSLFKYLHKNLSDIKELQISRYKLTEPTILSTKKYSLLYPYYTTLTSQTSTNEIENFDNHDNKAEQKYYKSQAVDRSRTEEDRNYVSDYETEIARNRKTETKSNEFKESSKVIKRMIEYVFQNILGIIHQLRYRSKRSIDEFSGEKPAKEDKKLLVHHNKYRVKRMIDDFIDEKRTVKDKKSLEIEMDDFFTYLNQTLAKIKSGINMRNHSFSKCLSSMKIFIREVSHKLAELPRSFYEMESEVYAAMRKAILKLKKSLIEKFDELREEEEAMQRTPPRLSNINTTREQSRAYLAMLKLNTRVLIQELKRAVVRHLRYLRDIGKYNGTIPRTSNVAFLKSKKL